MVIAIIVLVVVLGIVVGYAAGQREALLDSQETMRDLTAENIELNSENDDLRDKNKAHEFSLEMLIEEVEKFS